MNVFDTLLAMLWMFLILCLSCCECFWYSAHHVVNVFNTLPVMLWMFLILCLSCCECFWHSVCYRCTRKTFMIHQTFVRWVWYILFKFFKSLIRHLGLAIGNVWWFSWTLCYVVNIFNTLPVLLSNICNWDCAPVEEIYGCLISKLVAVMP